MTEPKSDCCGADVYYDGGEYMVLWATDKPVCSNCHKPCKVKEATDAKE